MHDPCHMISYDRLTRLLYAADIAPATGPEQQFTMERDQDDMKDTLEGFWQRLERYWGYKRRPGGCLKDHVCQLSTRARAVIVRG